MEGMGVPDLRRIPDRWIVLAGLMVARVGFGFAFQGMATLAPGLQSGLGLDGLAIGTLVGLFMLPGVVFAFPGGMLAQWLGERRVLVTGMLAMTAGALVCGSADGYTMLWIGRLICGIGAIITTVTMTKLVIDWFADKELATAMGVFLAGYPAGIALALVSLGPFATAAAWPVGFYITAALCAIGLVGYLATARPSPTAGGGGPAGVRLTRREFAMVSLSAQIASVYNGAFLVQLSFIPLYLVGHGLSPVTAASVVGAGVWVSILAVPLGGFVTDMLRRPNLIITLGAIIWAIGILLVPVAADTPALLAVIFAVAALVGAFPVGATVALASEVMRPQVRGPGMGLFYSWFYGFAAIAPAAAGLLVDVTGRSVTVIYVVTAGIAVSLAMLLLFRLAQRRLQPALAD